MEKIKIFWRTFLRSLKDTKYYQDVLKASFSFSAKYLLVLLFFIMFIQGIVFSLSLVQLFPKIPGYVRLGKEVTKDFYPRELTVTVNDGTIRTNVDEPYAIPFPKQLNVKDMFFAVIDTKAPIDDAKKYKSVLFINKSAIAYPDSNTKGGYKVYFLTNQKGYFIVNRETYDRTISRILPYFDYAPLMIYVLIAVSLFLLPLFGSVFYFSGVLFYLVILTILLFLIARLMKKSLSYTDVFRLGMHGITFSLVFNMLKSIFGITIPYTYTVPFIIWMILVFNSLENKHEPSITPAKPVQ